MKIKTMLDEAKESLLQELTVSNLLEVFMQLETKLRNEMPMGWWKEAGTPGVIEHVYYPDLGPAQVNPITKLEKMRKLLREKESASRVKFAEAQSRRDFLGMYREDQKLFIIHSIMDALNQD